MREVLSARSIRRPSWLNSQLRSRLKVVSVIPYTSWQPRRMIRSCSCTGSRQMSSSSCRLQCRSLICSHISVVITSRICRAFSRAIAMQLTMLLGLLRSSSRKRTTCLGVAPG